MTQILRLLQLSDSGIPIGGAAHSYGLEMASALQWVTVDNLEEFISTYLEETGAVDAVFCRAAFHADAVRFAALNDELSALRTSRELRDASIALGRRLLRLCSACEPKLELPWALSSENPHHAVAFGLICGALSIDAELAVAAFLHQTSAAFVSAAQRLLPLGQSEACRILWSLKPKIAAIAEQSGHYRTTDIFSFVPLLELVSMRHPRLETRLFIS